MLSSCCCFRPSNNSIKMELSTKNTPDKYEQSYNTQYMTYNDKNPFINYDNLPDNNSISTTPIQSEEISRLKKQNKNLMKENNNLKKELDSKNEELIKLKNDEDYKFRQSHHSLISNKSDESKKSNFSNYSVSSQHQIKKMESTIEKLKNPDGKKTKIKFVFIDKNEGKEYPIYFYYGDKDQFKDVIADLFKEYDEDDLISKGIKYWTFNDKTIERKSLIKDNNFTDVSRIVFS